MDRSKFLFEVWYVTATGLHCLKTSLIRCGDNHFYECLVDNACSLDIFLNEEGSWEALGWEFTPLVAECGHLIEVCYLKTNRNDRTR